jgi:hypothetical protein
MGSLRFIKEQKHSAASHRRRGSQSPSAEEEAAPAMIVARVSDATFYIV